MPATSRFLFHKQKKGEFNMNEKVKELYQKLEEGVKNFEPSPERFKAFLEMKALMPKYSFYNLMVARAQLEGATFLASFNHWKKLGRHVKKGQKAIYIFAPRFKKEEEEVNGEVQEVSKLAGFMTVPVFDISQTEGEPLPYERLKIELEGDCPEATHIRHLAEEMARRDHCPVIYGDSLSNGGANGYYSKSKHLIVVGQHLSPNHAAKTLVHELVHSRVHRYDKKASKTEKEIVAEGTAYVVCCYFGLDTSDYSFDYVWNWSGDEGQSLVKYGSIICDVAGAIIKEAEDIEKEWAAQEEVRTA
jgi:antirestriction protein ArdC